MGTRHQRIRAVSAASDPRTLALPRAWMTGDWRLAAHSIRAGRQAPHPQMYSGTAPAVPPLPRSRDTEENDAKPRVQGPRGGRCLSRTSPHQQTSSRGSSPGPIHRRIAKSVVLRSSSSHHGRHPLGAMGPGHEARDDTGSGARSSHATSKMSSRSLCSARTDHRRVFGDMADTSSLHGLGNVGGRPLPARRACTDALLASALMISTRRESCKP